jgi:hypothetical protein
MHILQKGRRHKMPAYLKPKMFADLISEAVTRAAADQSILAVGQETTRIARQTRLAPPVVASSLMEAAREAQVAMELPSLAELGISGDWRPNKERRGGQLLLRR